MLHFSVSTLLLRYRTVFWAFFKCYFKGSCSQSLGTWLQHRQRLHTPFASLQPWLVQFCSALYNVYLTSCLTSFPQLEPKKDGADKEHETEVQIQGVSHFKGSPAPLLSYLKARRRGLLKKGQYTSKLSLLRDTQS